jgi:hypothetical protein
MRFAGRPADGRRREGQLREGWLRDDHPRAAFSHATVFHTAMAQAAAALVAAALGTGLVGCAAGSPQATRAPAEPESRGQPPALEDQEQRLQEEAQAAVDAALRHMATLRGLEPQGTVKARHLDARQLVGEVEASLDRHVPPRAVQGTAELLFGLGTVPQDFDYRGSLLSLMGSELAGLYDPERKTMFLRADLEEGALEATLQHELVHALQDQHYGLARVLEWREDSTDELSALSALAEGDATSAMLDALLAGAGQRAYEISSELMDAQMRLMTGSAPESAGVPSILKRSLIAPYLDGLRFVNDVRREDDWSGVDKVWSRPPATTEQLLHLDKYAAAEPAIPVELPPPPEQHGPWEASFHDVWGEQSLRLVFEEWMPSRTAATQAAGWGGDRIVLYSSGPLQAVLWHVVADTTQAAERIHVGFLRGVHGAGWSQDPERLGGVSEQEAHHRRAQGNLCQERPEAGPFLAQRRGASVVVVAGFFERPTKGPPRAAADCALAKSWAEHVLNQAATGKRSARPKG